MFQLLLGKLTTHSHKLLRLCLLHTCPTLCKALRSFSDFSYCLVSSFSCSLTGQRKRNTGFGNFQPCRKQAAAEKQQVEAVHTRHTLLLGNSRVSTQSFVTRATGRGCVGRTLKSHPVVRQGRTTSPSSAAHSPVTDGAPTARGSASPPSD